MILQNAISGFNPPTNLFVDETSFRKICYSIVNSLSGEIISFNKPEAAHNYYQVHVTLDRKSLYILLNSTYPFLAFSSSVHDVSAIQFVDHEILSKEFNPYYRILRVDELNELMVIKESKGRIVVENENELNDAELNNIKYWKPKRVGDVVFNYWD